MHNILFALIQAAEHVAPEESAQSGDLLSPNGGLMFWTLVTFIIVLVILGRLVFPKITAAVEAREKALEEAIEGAKRDREEAARVLQSSSARSKRPGRRRRRSSSKAVSSARRSALR